MDANSTAITRERRGSLLRHWHDCPSCAAEIEKAVCAVGIFDVCVSIGSQVMTVGPDVPSKRLAEVEHAVAVIGYQIARLDQGKTSAVEEFGQSAGKQSQITQQYRRALWIVISLNVGYGIIKLVGGFIARSQALKADTLDFLGVGLISFWGGLAIGWSLAWRAYSALIQGLFLGLLGVGVLVGTAYRVIVLDQPEAELMGVLGAIALTVNILAAALMPHRSAEDDVRAVWLFWRNNAIGNVAVVAAAGLVTWTGTPWPDLLVAAIIAGLFLQASWVIFRDAQTGLSEATQPGFA